MATRAIGRHTPEQSRQTERSREHYERRGVAEDEADRRAAATVPQAAGGGQEGQATSGRGRQLNKAPAKAGGKVASPSSRRNARLKSAPQSSQHVPVSAQPPRDAQAANVDRGRQLICKEFARIAANGYGHFRARWFPQDERMQFQGEKANRWESIPDADYRGPDARSIAMALQAVRAKRTQDIQIKTHEKPDRLTFDVRVDKEALTGHSRQLASFWNAQLFWD